MGDRGRLNFIAIWKKIKSYKWTSKYVSKYNLISKQTNQQPFSYYLISEWRLLVVLSENTCSFIYLNFVRYVIGKKLEASKHTKSPTFSHGLCSSQTHAPSSDTVPEKLQCLVLGRVLRSWTTARTPSAVGGLWSSGASWHFGRGKEIWETTGETAGLHQRLTNTLKTTSIIT